MAVSVRDDLYYGAVYGLALSALLWTLTLSPPADTAWLVPLAMAAGAGALHLRSRWLGHLKPTYPAVLAHGLLFGPGAALVAGLLCELSAILCRPRASTRRSLRHAAFDLSATALAAALAGAAFALAGGGRIDGAGRLPGIAPLFAHLTAFALTRLALRFVRRRRTSPIPPLRQLALAASYALGSILAVLLAGLHAQPASRPWLAAAALLIVTEAVRRARRDAMRSRPRPEPQSSATVLAMPPPLEQRGGKGGLSLSLHELEVLYDISRAKDHDLDLEAYLTLVSCKLASLVSYRSLVAYFVDEGQDLLRAGFATGKAADKLRLTTVPMGQRWSGQAAARRRALIGQGPGSDLEDWGADAEMRDLTSSVVAPLLDEGQVVGVLALYDQLDREFTMDDRRILARVSGHVAQVVRRSRQSSSTAGTSLTDPLTGVPNARFLWLESAHRLSAPDAPGFGLLAFRVVGIEQVVECEGNAAADRLLCEIARRFAACSRSGETQVRFGQDLFIVLTPNHDPFELVERWHALAADVEQPPWSIRNGQERKIRLAASHASYPEDGETLAALLEALDTRLGSVAEGKRTVLPFPARRAATPA